MLLSARKSLMILLGALTLSGCDKTKEMFGLKREKPDEFTILSRPPLSAPPGIGLKPPLPQGMKPADQKSEAAAKEALLGTADKEQKENLSSAESSLLDHTNADEANPHIRTELAQSLDKESSDDSLIQDVLYWQKNDNEGKVINAHDEYEKHHGDTHPSK